MKFAYKKLASGIERPIIPIIVRNPATQQSVRYLALVDSGADLCVFAGEIGELIGLDVTAGDDDAYHAAPEELDAIDYADRSGVATDDEVETVLRSFRAL